MLAGKPVHTTLPAADIERARSFYSEKLGLTPESESPAGVLYRCGEATRFMVYPTQGSPSGAHTQMSWEVDNIEAEVAELKATGVVFEEYDFPNLKTENGVAAIGPLKVAWFKDSESNLLGIVQFL